MIVQFTIVKDLSAGVARYSVLQSVQDGREVFAAVHENVAPDALPELVRRTEDDFARRAGRDLFARTARKGK